MKDLLFHYTPVDPTTWVYLSSLLTIGLFFKFGRLWSLRNLDLFGLIALAPGLLLAEYGREMGDAWIEHLGYVWLFSAGGLFLIRLLIDPMMVRRPLLEPNLSVGGMTFLGLSLFVFLMANVLTRNVDPASLAAAQETEQLFQKKSPGDKPKGGARRGDSAAHRDTEGPALKDDSAANSKSAASPRAVESTEDSAGAADQLERNGPGLLIMLRIPQIPTQAFVGGALRNGHASTEKEKAETQYIVDVMTARLMAILSHLAIVVGMVVIGYRHFDNYKTGIAAATLYLMLPYTAQKTGCVDHVLPAALLIWALATYRRPLISGVLMGMAIGASYYPLFLLPLWLGFYWRRGLFRFVGGMAFTVAALVGVLALTSQGLPHFLEQMRQVFGLTLPWTVNTEGFWRRTFNEPVYRLPVLAAFAALSGSFALWPAQKNLGTLMGCTAAVMLGTQFWHAHGGGLYMAWYLPVLLLTIFRPNLEDRVALSVLGEGWKPKWGARGEVGVKAA